MKIKNIHSRSEKKNVQKIYIISLIEFFNLYLLI